MLAQQQQAIANQKANLQQAIEDGIRVRSPNIEKEIMQRLSRKIGVELEDLKSQLDEQKQLAKQAQANELELRKKAREVEEAQSNLQLELTRKLDSERKIIQEQATIKAIDEARLKMAEKDQQLASMNRKIEELMRKSEQGSQKNQGEAFEVEIESTLRSKYPSDEIEAIPNGVRGGDIIQRVISRSGQIAGTILWETKQTKNWKDEWIEKLKDDQRILSAELAILVTEVLPKGVSSFALINGVWVTDITSFEGIACALRHGLLNVLQTKLTLENRGEKIDRVYEYLTSVNFKQSIEAIVNTFKLMKGNLDKEKRVITKSWAEREKQLGRVESFIVDMYGDLHGIIGKSMPAIQALELQALEFEEEIPVLT